MRMPPAIATTTRALGLVVALLSSSCSKRTSAPEPAGSPAPAMVPRGPLDVPMMAPRLVATLEQTHVRARFAPDAAPDVACQVVLPKDWAFAKPSSAGAGPDGAVALGSATGPSAWGAPTIAVSATKPGVEIPIDTWLRASFAQGGYAIVSAKWFPSPSGLFFDVTGTRVHDGTEEVRRSSVRADGGHVFTVTCLVPRAHWDEVKDICWVAHDGLILEKKTGDTRLETWLTAQGKKPDFRMAYPAGWELTKVAPPRAKSSVVEVRLGKEGQPAPARLQVTVEPLSAGPSIAPLERLREATLDRAKALGFVPDGPLERLTETTDPRAVAVAGWLGGFAGKGQLGSSEAVLRMGFIRHDMRLTTFLAIAPRPPGDPTVAWRAQRAFEIARATVGAD
jgi:hypothetical protein